MTSIDWMRYEARGKYDPPLRASDCAAMVPDQWKSTGFHQCTRHGRHAMGGYLWCRQHAKLLRERMERNGEIKDALPTQEPEDQPEACDEVW